jgi:hypothetical protein
MRGGEQCAAAHCTDRSHGVGAATCTSAGAACPRDTAITFDCGAYACEAAFGACLSACNTSDQCADGHVCDTQSKTCVAAASDDAGGCDVGRGRAGAFSFLAALAVSALVARRRR